MIVLFGQCVGVGVRVRDQHNYVLFDQWYMCITSAEFYRGLSFSMHALIPGYYRISQKPADGLLLVCYCNGGETFSHSLSAYLRRYVTESVCCRMLDGLCCSLSQWLQAGWERAGMGRTSASKQHVTPPPCC